jgi:transcriptional regulator with XRE-family HTH domain
MTTKQHQSNIIEARRMQVNPLIRQNVDLSFQIVDRIHEILVAKGLKQKDLASLLGKKEAEISKWMRGTHNFTIDTLVSIEKALGAPILQVVHQEESSLAYEFESMMASEPLSPPEP